MTQNKDISSISESLERIKGVPVGSHGMTTDSPAPAMRTWPDGVRAPRSIEAEHLPHVHALIDRCYREYGLVLNIEDECEHHLLDPSTYFKACGGDYWVVLDESASVRATAALWIHTDRAVRTGELKSLYVDRGWRRHGLGGALTRHVMSAARAAGCTLFELWSDTRFTAAHRLYESIGFERFDRRELMDSNSSVEWGYRISLTGPRGDEPSPGPAGP